MQLRGRNVVLTGASGGIGSAIAHALDAAGANLLLSGRDAAALQNLQRQLRSGHAMLAADLCTEDGRTQLADAAAAFGADVLINNAGAGQLSLLEQSTAADLERIVAVNLVAPLLLCQAFLPILRKRPRATIVNIGSILGSIGYAGSTAYCASKFGLRGFTEALRRELADTAIDVVYFAPRATETALNSESRQALNRELGTAVDSPEQVAALLVEALTCPGRTNWFIGWPEKFFVRLNSLFPGVVDKALRAKLPTIRHHATIRTMSEELS
jgi:short-subunit dehydrogenase